MVQGVKRVKGPVSIINELVCPHNRVWDLDNFNKAVLDALKKNGIIEADDSRTVKELVTRVGDGPAGATVTVTPL